MDDNLIEKNVLLTFYLKLKQLYQVYVVVLS